MFFLTPMIFFKNNLPNEIHWNTHSFVKSVPHLEDNKKGREPNFGIISFPGSERAWSQKPKRWPSRDRDGENGGGEFRHLSCLFSAFTTRRGERRFFPQTTDSPPLLSINFESSLIYLLLIFHATDWGSHIPVPAQPMKIIESWVKFIKAYWIINPQELQRVSALT